MRSAAVIEHHPFKPTKLIYLVFDSSYEDKTMARGEPHQEGFSLGGLGFAIVLVSLQQ